jgi:DNA-binding MarR family transcriptional regulator
VRHVPRHDQEIAGVQGEHPVAGQRLQRARERPDLDLSALGVFGRIALLTAVLGPAVEQVFERHGLRRGEFDVLAAVRRSGPPYTLIPSKLSAALMMSRAGMTGRLDRLEQAGLVERRLDSDDRRSFLVSLTERGRAVIDATLTEHAANLARLISPLTPEETRTLERTLKTLLLGSREGSGA